MEFDRISRRGTVEFAGRGVARIVPRRSEMRGNHFSRRVLPDPRGRRRKLPTAVVAAAKRTHLHRSASGQQPIIRFETPRNARRKFRNFQTRSRVDDDGRQTLQNRGQSASIRGNNRGTRRDERGGTRGDSHVEPIALRIIGVWKGMF